MGLTRGRAGSILGAMQVVTECLMCRAPFRVEGWSPRRDPYFCAMCESLREAEQFANYVLREKKAEPPERWV